MKPLYTILFIIMLFSSSIVKGQEDESPSLLVIGNEKIELTVTGESIDIEVYNLTGKQVLKKTIQRNVNLFSTSFNAKGLHLVKIINKNGVVRTHRFYFK